MLRCLQGEGVNLLITASPQALAGSYSFSSKTSTVELCVIPSSGANGTAVVAPNAAPDQDCGSDAAKTAYTLFILGQILMGIGSSPLYTLGSAYLDENVPYARLPVRACSERRYGCAEKLLLQIYIGVFLAMAAVGPALGWMGGSTMLKIWVDPGMLGGACRLSRFTVRIAQASDPRECRRRIRSMWAPGGSPTSLAECWVSCLLFLSRSSRNV